jgi:monofunctional biosynthetic peptidoglycan transglycosylase
MWQTAKKWITRTIFFLVLIPVVAVVTIRWIDPPTSSIMLQNNIQGMLSGNPLTVEFQWRDWEEISGHLAVAVIASEDQRFPSHFGIDFKELGNVLSSDKKQKRGASTITQQVAKNLFLWPTRSYTRKILEAGLAVLIEIFWSKQRILEVYLNIAQMGDNLFGAGAASVRYFNKPPLQLNRFEAARIAAILPNPSGYSAEHASTYVVKRQQWILGQMKQLGGLSLLQQLK